MLGALPHKYGDSWASARVKATNRTFEGHWVMAFTFRNARVTNIREYNDTLTVARASEMGPATPVIRITDHPPIGAVTILSGSSEAEHE